MFHTATSRRSWRVARGIQPDAMRPESLVAGSPFILFETPRTYFLFAISTEAASNATRGALFRACAHAKESRHRASESVRLIQSVCYDRIFFRPLKLTFAANTESPQASALSCSMQKCFMPATAAEAKIVL